MAILEDESHNTQLYTDSSLLKPVTGTDDGSKHRLDVASSLYELMVTKGLISGTKIMFAMGERESIGTGTPGEDITRMNELSATPSAPASHTIIPKPADAGEQLTIISENAADNGATATGALTVNINYLDPSGNEQVTTVTMNGTTAVDITPTNVRFVQDMAVATVGSNGVAVGHIRIYKKTDATLVYNMIAAGGNQSLVPHRMVPNGKTLHVMHWLSSEGNNKRITLRLRADHTNAVPPVRQDGVFLFKASMYLNQDVGDMPVAFKVPALSVVKVSGWAIVANAEVATTWWGYLIDD